MKPLMLRLGEASDLVVVGSVGLAVIGAFLLIVLANRVCLVAKALRRRPWRGDSGSKWLSYDGRTTP